MPPPPPHLIFFINCITTTRLVASNRAKLAPSKARLSIRCQMISSLQATARSHQLQPLVAATQCSRRSCELTTLYVLNNKNLNIMAYY